MKKSNLLFLLLFLPVINVFAQQESSFDRIVITKNGEINNDELLDQIVVTQDTISEFKPYRLEIYFGTKKGGEKLILRTDKAIQPDFPVGKENILTGEGFYGIELKDHILTIKHVLSRGFKEHKFKFRNGKFEMIEYNYIKSDGRRKIFYESIYFDKLLRKTKTVSYINDRVLEENEDKLSLEFIRTLEDLDLIPDGQ